MNLFSDHTRPPNCTLDNLTKVQIKLREYTSETVYFWIITDMYTDVTNVTYLTMCVYHRTKLERKKKALCNFTLQVFPSFYFSVHIGAKTWGCKWLKNIAIKQRYGWFLCIIKPAINSQCIRTGKRAVEWTLSRKKKTYKGQPVASEH